MATESKRIGSGGFKSSAGARFGTLEQVFDDIWWAWGTVRVGPGILFPRNMTIVRERGELVVIHPVLMPDAEQKKIEALGPIKHIVRLGAFHGMDDPAYVERYHPTVWAPPGVDHRPGVATDKELVPGGEVPILVRDARRERVFAISGQGPAPAAATIERVRAEGFDLLPPDGLVLSYDHQVRVRS